MSTKTQVFIVDDDSAMRRSLEAVVSSLGLHAQCFQSAEEFLETPEAHAGTGCLLADMRLPGMSGLELLDQLPLTSGCFETIIITAFAETELTVRAIRSGAMTVLEKPVRDHEICANIQLAIEKIQQKIKCLEETQDARRRFESLNDDEVQILEMLMAGKPNKAMASQLKVSTRTIENRRRQLYEKMNVQSVPELVRMVVELRSMKKSNTPVARKSNSLRPESSDSDANPG